MAQLHMKFTDSQIKELLERYVRNEIERRYIQEVLGIKNSGFFILIKRYRENPKGFSLVLALKYEYKESFNTTNRRCCMCKIKMLKAISQERFSKILD